MKKIYVTLFIFFVFAGGTRLSTKAFSQAENPLVHAEQMPYFPGCEKYSDGSEEKRICSNETLVSFLAHNVQYPPTAKLLGTEGTVYVSFIVDENGDVTNTSIIRDIGDGCGEAALEVLKKMPKWEPGMDKGKIVKVKLNLPIHFSLKNNNAIAAKSDEYQIQWGNLKGKKILEKVFRENVQNEIIVRDRFGEAVIYDELVFSYERGRVFNTSSSNGKMDKKQKRIAQKVKAGGKFYVGVVIQKGDEKIKVGREFKIVE